MKFLQGQLTTLSSHKYIQPMSSDGLFCLIKALVQIINMLLVVFPLVRFLGLAECVFWSLSMSFWALQALQVCPFPIPVVIDRVEYFIALGVCQLLGNELPRIKKSLATLVARNQDLHSCSGHHPVHPARSATVLARIGLERSVDRCLARRVFSMHGRSITKRQ
jgi:hypothetical protein